MKNEQLKNIDIMIEKLEKAKQEIIKQEEEKEREIEKGLYFLKIHRDFLEFACDGLISYDTVEKIAETGWKIEELTCAKNNK